VWGYKELPLDDRWTLVEVPYAQFARLLGFGRGDANHPKIHMALCLEASKLKFMYPRNKGGSCRITTDLLPVYAYLNHLFRKTMTSREGDSTTFPPTIKTF
jgi:hypothetical protein